MRCKIGDLAIVKRGVLGLKHAGKIVEITGGPWADLGGEGPGWSVLFREPIALMNGLISRHSSAPDAWLMPIRDPGHDAVDETIRERPAPKQATPERAADRAWRELEKLK